MKAFLDSAYTGQMKFWDESVLKKDEKFLKRLLGLFVVSQDLNKSQKESDEFRHFYSAMIEWMDNHLGWSSLTQNKLMDIYEDDKKEAATPYSREEKYELFKSKTKHLEERINSYEFKFIIFHITLFLTRSVNKHGEITVDHYNAACRTFLFNFMACFYSGRVAKVVVRSMERAIADFNYEVLEYTYQHPLENPTASVFKDSEKETQIDALGFLKNLNDKDKDFINFIKNSQPMNRVGKKLVYKEDVRTKDIEKAKLQALQNAKKTIHYSKKKDLLKADLELLSKKAPTSKHIVISVAGLLSERGNLTDKWVSFLEKNPSLSVYAYRWAAKSDMPTWKSFLPSLGTLFSIKSWFTKSFLAYQAVKIPYDYRKKFIRTIDLAKEYGKILANLLILQFPFINQSISLIGFELGAQVIYSCLEELYNQNADNIIHNVYFMKGAVSSGNSKQWSKVLSVVKGTVYNQYSAGDKALYMFKTVTFSTPIGISPLLDIEETDDMSKNQKIQYDKYENLKKDIRVKNINCARLPTDSQCEETAFSQTLNSVNF